MSYIQVITTTATQDEAEQIAWTLVEARLAACVQIIGPIMSLYRWKGQIEKDHEFQCWVKTRQDLFERVEKAIRTVHPYEIPEIIALPILDGSASYLQWLDESLEPPMIAN
jgi:periplasmic divalent cation tolerance protein